MGNSSKPDIKLARRVLPRPLMNALVQIFSQNIKDVVLVEGTALSGFYAGHRRSNDIDLFVKDETGFTQAVLAVKSLKKINCNIHEASHSNQYFKAVCNLKKYTFTVDVVLDENIFSVGKFHTCGKNKGIVVADLLTIFMMKSAALISRCSEKDLYDILWLIKNLNNLKISDIIQLGKKIDAGMNIETLLYAVSSSEISKEACNFSLDPEINSKLTFKQISRFKKELVKEFSIYLETNTESELKAIIDRINHLK